MKYENTATWRERRSPDICRIEVPWPRGTRQRFIHSRTHGLLSPTGPLLSLLLFVFSLFLSFLPVQEASPPSLFSVFSTGFYLLLCAPPPFPLLQAPSLHTGLSFSPPAPAVFFPYCPHGKGHLKRCVNLCSAFCTHQRDFHGDSWSLLPQNSHNHTGKTAPALYSSTSYRAKHLPTLCEQSF